MSAHIAGRRRCRCIHVGRWSTGKNPENSERSIRGVGELETDEAVQNGGTIENALMAHCEISN